MGYGQKRGELWGAYQRRMRDEKMAGRYGSNNSPSAPHHNIKLGRSVYYTGGSSEPEKTKAEIVMHRVDWGVMAIEPVVTLLLLSVIPGLGLINGGVTAVYLGSRLYHAAMSEQIGKPIDDFIESNWQKFQQVKK